MAESDDEPPRSRPAGVVRRTTERAQHVVDDTSARYAPARYLVLAYERFRRLNGSILAASIAFRVFLFLVPLTLTLVGLAGYSAASGNDLQKDANGLGAALASTVAQAGNDSRRSWWVLILVGVASMLYTASSLFSTLSRSSAQLWEMWEYQPTPARQRLRFIGGLLLTLAYLLLSRWIHTNVALDVVLHVVSIAAHVVLAVLLLAFLPNRANHWSDLVPGALVTSAGLVGINVFTVVWLPHKLASLSATYGALGVAVATLSFLALVGYLLVAAILTNVMWHEYRMSREATA
jgi:membrane protein